MVTFLGIGRIPYHVAELATLLLPLQEPRWRSATDGGEGRSAIVPCGGGGQATNMSRLGFPDVAWCSIEFLVGESSWEANSLRLLHKIWYKPFGRMRWTVPYLPQVSALPFPYSLVLPARCRCSVITLQVAQEQGYGGLPALPAWHRAI
jgi:hypothetical protein